MNRLTKTYSDGTFGVSNDMANRQNSHAFKEMLINKVGAYEDTGLTPAEVVELAQAKEDGLVLVIPCKVGDTVFSLWSRVDSKKQYIRSATVTVSNLFYYLRRIQDGASFVSRDEAQAALDRMEGQK